MEYILKRPKNSSREFSGEIASVGRHGVVRSVSAVRSAWNLKQRAQEVVKSVELASGCPFEREANSPQGEKNGAAPLSLGYGTYLDAGFSSPQDSMVAEVMKNPQHRWSRFDQKRGVRGKIVGFSSGSRMRLMKKAASLPKGCPCHFVTLTTPFELSASDLKEHLWALWRRFERKWEGKRVGMIWKMEPHKSGEWHFHLLVYGCKFIPHLWLKANWADVLGTAGVKGAFHFGADVTWVDGNLKAVQAYVSKYFGKDVEAGYYGEECGRVWGCRGDLPIKDKVQMGLTVLELIWVWRIISRKRKTNVVKMSPMLLSNSPPDFAENAKRILRPRKANPYYGMRQMSAGKCEELEAQIAKRKKWMAQREAELAKLTETGKV